MNAPDQAAPSATGGVLHDVIWGNSRRQGVAETVAKQAARTVGSKIGGQILRGVLGSIVGGLFAASRRK